MLREVGKTPAWCSESGLCWDAVSTRLGSGRPGKEVSLGQGSGLPLVVRLHEEIDQRVLWKMTKLKVS